MVAFDFIKPSVLRRLTFIFLLLALTSCGYSVKHLTDNEKINGIPASSIKIEINKPFVYDNGFHYYNFPVGEYRPIYASEEGVFFESVKPVLAVQLAQTLTFKGGLVIKANELQKPRAYIASDKGIISIWDLDFNADYSIK